ncbi:hypothetical protein ACF0H5_024521 [Mactra antiquata]
MVGTAVHEVCTSNLDCPSRATCKPTSCDGYTCLCDNGYVSSVDRSSCVIAVRIGDSCDMNTTRCISEYAQCESGICTCIRGFQATKDGRCKLPGTNFVGERCGSCEFPAQCINGECKCEGDFRSLTMDEFWVDPISVLQCRPRDYSLTTCNGTSILTGSDKTPTPPTNVNSQSINTNDWSLILPEKSIYETCSSHSQCPAGSRCRPNSCDGFVCLCDVGMVPSEDRLQCLSAVKTGATCDRRLETCLSPFAKCVTGICKCDPYFSPTIDGRCRLSQTRYVGENCRSSDDCEYPGACVNGMCACVDQQRELTKEEFWIDTSLTIQCRPSDYSVWKCNNTIINIPAQFQNEIPIDIEIELTYKKESKAHNGVDHEDHVEINPTIIVDEPSKDSDYFVPLQIAGVLVAAMFALLIACIIKTKRRKAIKRDISLTRTNILANKQLAAAEEEMANNLHLRMEHAQTSPGLPPQAVIAQQQMGSFGKSHDGSKTIPRPNLAIYNKTGWHESFGDRSFYDNNTDIYPESTTTTRSTRPFIVDTPQHGSPTSMNGGIGIVAPYTINRNGPYVIDGQPHDSTLTHPRNMADAPHRVTSHYVNNVHEWRSDCQSENEPDVVMF